MNILEIKGSLFDLLWQVDDAETLLKIRKSVAEIIEDAKMDGADWWDELLPEQQVKLERALNDAEKGKNLVSHEKALDQIDYKIKKLRHAS